VITVKEIAAPPQGQFARFFAQADKHVNQKIAPSPTGWGNSLLDALTACARMIREFPYEGRSLSGQGRPWLLIKIGEYVLPFALENFQLFSQNRAAFRKVLVANRQKKNSIQ